MSIKSIFLVGGFALQLTLGGTVSAQTPSEAGSLRAEIEQLQANHERLVQELQQSRKELGLAAVELAKMQQWKQSLPPELRRRLEIGHAVEDLLHEKSSAANKTPEATGDPFPALVENTPKQIYFRELLGNSDYAKAVTLVERHQVRLDYGLLFKSLHLNPADQAKLEDLLVEHVMTKQDVASLDEEDAQPERMKTRVGQMREWRETVAKALGPAVAKAVRKYEDTLRFRKALDSMETRLSYTSTPLQPGQSEQLLKLLVDAIGPKAGTRYWSVPDQVIVQAQAILSPPQVEVLKQIQEEQNAPLLAGDTANGESPAQVAPKPSL